MDNNNSIEAEIPLAEVNGVEQTTFHSEERDMNPNSTMPEFSLPPVDGGRDAWLCLLGCFFIEAFVWGEYIMIYA